MCKIKYSNWEKKIKAKENSDIFNQQYSLYNEELHFLVYPKHLKFGFNSFVLIFHFR